MELTPRRLSSGCKMAEQEGLEPPTLSGSRFQGGFFIQPGLLQLLSNFTFLALREQIFYYKEPNKDAKRTKIRFTIN